MRTTKTKLVFGLVILCTALWGTWIVTRSQAAADTPATGPTPDNELQQLLSERRDIATKMLDAEQLKLQAGKSTLETVCQAARLVLDAELELSTTPDNRVAALTKYVALVRQLEQEGEQRVKVGAAGQLDVEALRYWRLTGEIELLRAKRASAR